LRQIERLIMCYARVNDDDWLVIVNSLQQHEMNVWNRRSSWGYSLQILG